MRRILLIAAALAIAAPAAAQQSQQTQQTRPMPMFRAMDTDNDGVISRREFLDSHQAGGRGYSAADADNDGTISRDEFMDAGQQRQEARFKQLDANGDGRLTRNEAQPDALSAFRAMDADGDGRITRDEMRYGRGMGPGQQQGMMPDDMPMWPGRGQR